MTGGDPDTTLPVHFNFYHGPQTLPWGWQQLASTVRNRAELPWRSQDVSTSEFVTITLTDVRAQPKVNCVTSD